MNVNVSWKNVTMERLRPGRFILIGSYRFVIIAVNPNLEVRAAASCPGSKARWGDTQHTWSLPALESYLIGIRMRCPKEIS